MVKSGRILAVAAVLTLGGTSQAHGEIVGFFRHYCTPGAIRACVSVQIETVFNPITNKTAVFVRVANHEGWSSAPFSTLPTAALYRIVIKNENDGGPEFDDPDPERFEVVARGRAGFQGTPGSEWELDAEDDEIKLKLDDKPEGAIFGCHVSAEGEATGSFFRTCEGGWVEFSFETEYRWSENIDLSLEWKALIGDEKYKCDTDEDDDDDDEYCVPMLDGDTMTTPEPATLILLGSGLLGLGGVGIIRRRRGINVESD